jgi:Right handed beta helix region
VLSAVAALLDAGSSASPLHSAWIGAIPVAAAMNDRAATSPAAGRPRRGGSSARHFVLRQSSAREGTAAATLARQADATLLPERMHDTRTLRICPPATADPDCRYTSLHDALAVAMPGDEAVLAPGVYEEGAVITTPHLVLRGEPGAHLRGHAVEGKAALVVKAAGVVIEGIECSGIAVRDNNGACVRIEGDDLTVRNVHFHDNQQGILSGSGGGLLLVEGSLLERNGLGGQAHGVYIGRATQTFIFRNNRVLATTGAGHGVKSRAQSTIIENNVIAGLDGHDSRAIDLPNGGDVVIRGNVLEKGPNSANAQMIGLALEGDLHEVNHTLIESNLVIFDTLPVGLVQRLGQALGLMPPKGTVLTSESPGQVILRSNTIVAARAIGSRAAEQDNRMYQSRGDAGLAPYPAVPAAAR